MNERNQEDNVMAMIVDAYEGMPDEQAAASDANKMVEFLLQERTR